MRPVPNMKAALVLLMLLELERAAKNSRIGFVDTKRTGYCPQGFPGGNPKVFQWPRVAHSNWMNETDKTQVGGEKRGD